MRIASEKRLMTSSSFAYTAEVWPRPKCSVTSSQARIPCSTEGERTSPSTGISFSAMNGCAASASRSVGSGASSTLSVVRHLEAGEAGQVDARLPEDVELHLPSSVKDRAASASDSCVGEQPGAHPLELVDHLS